MLKAGSPKQMEWDPTLPILLILFRAVTKWQSTGPKQPMNWLGLEITSERFTRKSLRRGRSGESRRIKYDLPINGLML